ncbi:MAG TPA: DUF2188 domain-containing protein [Myxococcales bacterium]
MLDAWPRVVALLTHAGLQAERAVFDANLLAPGALVAADPRSLDAWAESVERTQQAALDLWRGLVLEGARCFDATTTELRHSAVQLLDELENEKALRERAERQHDGEKARAEHERTERQAVERERDEQRQRADDEHSARRQAERTIERLERDLAKARERVAAAAERAQSSQPPAVNVVQRDEDWAVVREDAKRASGVFTTKRQAVQRAKEIARREGAEVQIEPSGDGTGPRS